MREEAVCSRIDISLTSPPPPLLWFSLHLHRWTTKAGMDKRRLLPKQRVTVSIGTSLCVYYHFLLLLLLGFSKPPPISQVVLATEMARRLISVTGQWASDCQLNWPCVLVGSLRIQAHSHRLTGPTHRGPLGSRSTTFLSKKRSLSVRINTQAHAGAPPHTLTHIVHPTKQTQNEHVDIK